MKPTKCSDCGFTIDDYKEWNKVFELCVICTEIMVEEMVNEMKKRGEEDGEPERLMPRKRHKIPAFSPKAFKQANAAQ